MKKEDPPVIVEQDFDRSVSDVWDAITQIDEMRKWYFENIPDFKAEVGFATQFVVESGNRSLRHMWTVTEVDPHRKLVYDWKYEGLAGDSFVSWEVSGEKKSARLRVSTLVKDIINEINFLQLLFHPDRGPGTLYDL